MQIERAWLEQLIFRAATSRRFTQDSPVLPDVWLEFGTAFSKSPASRVDLLITPHRDASASELGAALRYALREEQESPAWRAVHRESNANPELAYSQANVAVRLTLSELIRVALPLSQWWKDAVPGEHDNLDELLLTRPGRFQVINSLSRLSMDTADARRRGKTNVDSTPPGETAPDVPPHPLSDDLLWMIRVVGTILLASRARHRARVGADQERFVALSRDYAKIVNAFGKFVSGMYPRAESRPLLFSVSRNRLVSPTVSRSVLAVKADATRRLFNVDCSGLCWAVLDSGIDATHFAFRKRDKDGKPMGDAFELDETRGRRWVNNTRVVRTFDFTKIRQLLNPDVAPEDKPEYAPMVVGAQPRDSDTREPGENEAFSTEPQLDIEALHARAAELTRRLKLGRSLDWDELEPFLEILHDDHTYSIPLVEHGTHVAGILASDWRKGDPELPAREEGVIGVCPDLCIYDFRVLNDEGFGDEFTVMAALQFIRHLNATRDQPAIHGANLSLSLKHDVANYACGRTPVCDECQRVVSAGVVVVAAAGNDGYMRFTTPAGDSEGYRSISISDPGNAEAVITVGATHRYQAHTYGVSYFSSRGPTGDGRAKPDIVAPGEKITAPIPNNLLGTMDGTSMAAPHVSGAAALLMGRHRELLGRPARVKAILCTSATDLGRERYFQGAGMLDVLRALQSV